MKVSLRKANALQVAINDAIKGLEFNPTVSINEFQLPEKEIEHGYDKFNTNLDRRANLLDALYEIRKSVAAANVANGIDTRLADLARLEKDLVFVSAYAKQPVRTSLEVIRGKLAKISNRSEDSYYGKTEVETSIFQEEDLETFRISVATVKKQKQALQDQLIELNVSTTITLSDAAVNTLSREDIL
jgi:hypothetical protein